MADIFDQVAQPTVAPGPPPQAPKPAPTGGGDIFDQITSQPSAKQMQDQAAQPDTSQDIKWGEVGAGAGEEASGIAQGAMTPLPVQSILDIKGGIGQYGTLLDAYEKNRKSGKGILESAKAAQDVADAHDMLADRVKEFNKNPSKAAGRAIVDIVTFALGSKLGDVMAEGAPEPQPSLAAKIIKGEKVAQPQAESALRTGAKEVGSAAPQSLRESLTTPIDDLGTQAKSLYQQVDKAAGTDFKGLRTKLENTEYQLRQLTETEADVAQEAKLEASRTAIMDKIEVAKQQAIAKGVDPGALDKADQLFRQKSALQDLETKVFKNPSIVEGNQALGTPETIKVDAAVKALQKLQDNEKYGAPRLEQALGKEGAQALLKDMYEAQRVGADAISKQAMVAKIGKALKIAGLAGGALTGVYELTK